VKLTRIEALVTFAIESVKLDGYDFSEMSEADAGKPPACCSTPPL
jgi:hypothetical protein